VIQKSRDFLLQKVILILILGSMPHCMSVVTLFSDHPERPIVYGGVRGDLHQLMGMKSDYYRNIDTFRFLFVIDLPFTLVADTILLPVTLPMAALGSSENDSTRNDDLLRAVRAGDVDRVVELLGKGANANIGYDPQSGRTLSFDELAMLDSAVPLLYPALENGSQTIAALLLKNGTIAWPTIRHAIRNKNHEALKRLLHHGVSADEILEQAVRESQREMIVFAVKNGADINMKSRWGKAASEPCTPLLYFASKSDRKGVQTLLQFTSLDINAVYYRGSALHEAVRNKDIELVRLLVKAGINRSLRDDRKRTATDLADKIQDDAVKNSLMKLLK